MNITDRTNELIQSHFFPDEERILSRLVDEKENYVVNGVIETRS